MSTFEIAADAALFDDGKEVVVYRSTTRSGFALRGLWGDLLGVVWHRVIDGGADSGELVALLAERGVDREEATDFLAELTRRGVFTDPAEPAPLSRPLERISVAGLPRAASLLTGLLSEQADGEDPTPEIVDWVPGEVAAPGSRAVVVVADATEIGLFREANRDALRSGSPFLTAMLGAGTVTLGPTVIPGGSACFECYWTRRTMEDDAATPQWITRSRPRIPGSAGKPGANSTGLHMATALLAREISRLRHGAFGPALVSKVSVLDEATFSGDVHAVFPVPSCRACALTEEVVREGTHSR
ncbi:bacteriocin biosynthesis cyclodehydratase domain-containing protein [Streptomyces sp. BK022]|uniref:TOMM precursor leader peptide-binding protein n=1 Tax=Streptomyces sp. BK022 TaxID=2512123 RepID=UPI0010288172|nr:TOMM precursor leader peptide-binding protein [Streptomyces sp. BK022]RZU45543.1 bacteriocin biosynthesis cyclodehydratase domain-containing protein [Streptomyces sp. BK022]